MKKLINVKLRHAHMETIKKVSDRYGYTLSAAKEFVKEALNTRVIELDNCLGRLDTIRSVFDGEYVDDDEKIFDRKEEKPDDKTADAFNWMAGLSTQDQEKIKLITKWETRGMCYPACG